MSVIDDYLTTIEPDKRAELIRIKTIAKQLVPNAKEVISYGMPTLSWKGTSFLGFNAHKSHIGIYPYGGEEIALFKDKLNKANISYSKGAVQVPFDKPIAKELLVEIITHRINRIKEKK